MIIVFNRPNTRDDEVVSGLKHFDPVAIVNLPDWQYKLTFELTNSIEHAWWKNDRVQPIFLGAHQNAGCRSTSVGDRVMLSDGRVMEVMPFGWQYQTDDNSEYWNKVRWGFYINTNRCEHDQVE